MACCEEHEAERQTYPCRKHGVEMCAACMHCKDPDLYCKFRSACLIHFMDKERRRGTLDQD